MALDLAQYIEALRVEGDRFAAAIRAAAPDAEIPTCSDWTMRDLVLHQGDVHRWAAAIVRDGIAKPSALGSEYIGELPSDGDLLAWFVAGHAQLVETLVNAAPDVAPFTFLADPPAPLLFWSRRQVHETGIHRVDAESAVGPVTAFAPAIATDGIDEMLSGFVPRRHTPLHADPAVVLQVGVDDAPPSTANVWQVTISDGSPTTERGRSEGADCWVSGPADAVYRTLWNRASPEMLDIGGNPAVFDMFLENVRIRRA